MKNLLQYFSKKYLIEDYLKNYFEYNIFDKNASTKNSTKYTSNIAKKLSIYIIDGHSQYTILMGITSRLESN